MTARRWTEGAAMPWRGERSGGDAPRRGRRPVHGRAAAIALALCAAVPVAVAGQPMPPPDIGLVGGSFSYDLGVRGDATSPFGGLRVRFPLSRWILVEPALAFTRLTADSVEAGADRHLPLLLMEFQAQVQYPLDRLRPYVGVGAGAVVDFRSHRGTDAFLMSTYSAALGLAVDLDSRWGVRSEVRRRAIDDGDHSALELSLALSTRF